MNMNSEYEFRIRFFQNKNIQNTINSKKYSKLNIKQDQNIFKSILSDPDFKKLIFFSYFSADQNLVSKSSQQVQETDESGAEWRKPRDPNGGADNSWVPSGWVPIGRGIPPGSANPLFDPPQRRLPTPLFTQPCSSPPLHQPPLQLPPHHPRPPLPPPKSPKHFLPKQ